MSNSDPGPAHGRRISVTGLGYVGLPVAVAFARTGTQVIAFDIDAGRIEELQQGFDRTGEVSKTVLAEAGITYTTNPDDLAQADFHIVTVPTPITADNRPDLGALKSASDTVAKILKVGDIVVFESTVYPGVTEDVCRAILAAQSGLVAGRDFTVGYSPERINPGDTEHRLETVIKVVAGEDAATLDIVADVYSAVVTAGIFRAANIRTAEAAKVIENTQRDLNIALMNELAMIFDRLDIDTHDVLAASSSKWNFLPFSPGLVGGHCIGVDPFYLTHRAEQVGYHPQVILSGRRVNDAMGVFVARKTLEIIGEGSSKSAAKIIVLGLTFKENVPDIRNTRTLDIVKKLTASGAEVEVHDPLIDGDMARRELGLTITPLDQMQPADAVILAVAHRDYVEAGWPLMERLLAGDGNGSGLVIDVRCCLERNKKPEHLRLWRL